jgi:hypothetical protein
MYLEPFCWRRRPLPAEEVPRRVHGVVAVCHRRGDSVRGRFGRSPACQREGVLGDVQYPTLWLPVGLGAAVLVGASVWPGERFTRVVVALALIGLVIVGYVLLPQLFDVDTLFRG